MTTLPLPSCLNSYLFSVSSPKRTILLLVTSIAFLLSTAFAQECGTHVGAQLTCEVPPGTADLSIASVDTRSFNGVAYGSFRTSQSQVKTLFPWSALPGSVRFTGVVTPRGSSVPHIFTADLTKNGLDTSTPYLFCSPTVVRTSDGSTTSGNFQGTNQVVFPIDNTTVTCTLDFDYPIAYTDTLKLSRSTPTDSELALCFDNNCQARLLGDIWTETGSAVYSRCSTLLAPFSYGAPAGCNNTGTIWPNLSVTTIGADLYYCNVSADPPFFIVTKPAECNDSLPQTTNNVTYDCVVRDGRYQLVAIGCNSANVGFTANQIQLIDGQAYYCNTDIPALEQLTSATCEVQNQTISLFGSLVINNIIYKCVGQGAGELVAKSTGCQDQFGVKLKAGEVSEDSGAGVISVCGYDTVNNQYFFAPLTCVNCAIDGKDIPIGKLTIVGTSVYTCFVSYSGQVSSQLVGSLSPCLGY